MRVKIIETRHYVGIGVKHKGDVLELTEHLANQLIRQNLAMSIEETKHAAVDLDVMEDEEPYFTMDEAELHVDEETEDNKEGDN